MNKKLIISISLLLLIGTCHVSASKNPITNDTDEAISVEMTNAEKKKVEEIKNIFNITGAYESFTIVKEPMPSDIESDFLNKLIKNKFLISYRWSDEKLGEANVMYNSDGEFISFYKWSLADEKKENIGKNYSKEDVQKATQEILTKTIKDFNKKYILSDYEINPNSKDIELNYRRVVRDIPVFDDFINVNFSSNLGKIVSIDLMGDNSYINSFLQDKDFKDQAKISLEDAQKIFLEKSPLSLYYKVSSGRKSVEKVYSSNVLDIDATTGKVFKNNFKSNDISFAKTEEAKDTIGLTEVEVKKIDAQRDLKKKSEAKKKAAEIVGKSYEITNIALSSDKDNYYYKITLEKGKNYGEITLNAKTLNLVSLNIYTDKKDVKTKVPDEEAKKIALNFLENYGDKTELNLEKIDLTKFDYCTNIFIPRYVNSIPVLDEGVFIAVDDEKNVVLYEKDFSNIDFSKARDINLTKDEANKIYFNSKNFGLKYEMTESGPKLFYGKLQNILPIIGEDKILRDKSGNIVNFKNQISYDDFNSAKNKEAINYLKDMGYGTIGKKLSDKITYEEFIELIHKNYGLEYYDDNRYGIDMSKVKNKKITEKDVIKFLIIDNGLQDFTKAKGIFKDNLFKNQKSLKEYENYYIIAKGYGYIGDEINPDKELSLEEILYIIYNSIN